MSIQRFLSQWMALGLMLHASSLFALTFPLPEPGNDLVGELVTVSAQPKDNIADIGRDYNIGGEEMVQANPQIKGKLSKHPTEVIVPREFILPNVPRTGIVINLPELRLYYFDKDNQVHTFPLGIGRQGWKTPTMQTSVSKKVQNPTWFVPDSIRAARAKKGEYLPKVVPPGPNNPLGKFQLRLGNSTILLHGTNAPNTVGWRVSHGCMRMLPDDIKYMYMSVPVGTPVNIINQPFKVGIHGKDIYLEVQKPLHEDPAYRDKNYKYVTEVINNALGERRAVIQWEKVYAISDSRNGIPAKIGQLFD